MPAFYLSKRICFPISNEIWSLRALGGPSYLITQDVNLPEFRRLYPQVKNQAGAQ
jgi:hypothetical protein